MNINELEKLAKQATPGPWHSASVDFGQGPVCLVSLPKAAIDPLKTENHIAAIMESENAERNSEFIAAANPDTVMKLIAVARAAIEWRDTRGDEDHPAARSRLAVTVERLCPSTKWWCEQCDVESIAAIGTPCPECGGTGDPG